MRASDGQDGGIGGLNADPKVRPIDEARSRPLAETRPRSTMPLLRQLLIVAAVLAALGGGYVAYDRLVAGGGAAGPTETAAPAAIPVVLGTAELRETTRRVEAVGTTFSRRAIQVVALTSGRIVEVAFEPGQFVEAGAVLVRLDDDIERADLAEAEATLQENALALQRAQALRQKSAIPEATVEQLVAAQASARAELDRARRRLDDRTVRAPFAGDVGLRQIDPGARVDEEMVLTTLDDRSEMEIEFSVPEMLYGQVAIGQPVVATSAAFPGRSFEGLVATIDSRVDSTARAFKVRALLPNPDLALPAGMFMHVAVVLESRTAVMVPEEAVVVQGNRTFVYVVADGKAAVRDVTLGQRELGAVEVTSGLTQGDAVVVRGTPRLRDGAAVRVLGEDGTPAGQGEAGSGPAGPS
jgi:membrane fusion protein (multidrug efflux system)